MPNGYLSATSKMNFIFFFFFFSRFTISRTKAIRRLLIKRSRGREAEAGQEVTAEREG